MLDVTPSVEPALERTETAVATLPTPPVMEAIAASVPANRNALYAVVWRWHFYAGLFTAPILMFVIATGTIYVFKTEISAWRDREWRIVTPQADRLSYETLKAKATEAVSPHELEAMIVHPEANRSIRFVAHVESSEVEDHGDHHEERHLSLFMNPYTGEVLGRRIDEEEFFSIVLQLHRTLWLGTTGRILSELATSWGALLMATGIFLWWPRGKKNVGVWMPRVKGKLYAVLRDWHAVGGLYLVPLGGLIVFTGLFFTVVWGTGFNTTVKKIGHWAPAWFGELKVEPPQPDAPLASLDEVVATLVQNSRPHDNIMLRLASKPGTANKVFLLQDENKNSYRMVAINPYTAESIDVVDGDELPFMYRVRLWAVSIHMGQIFGLPTKILAFITSLGLFVLGVTGLWMWWERRPTGRAGFPRRPVPRSLPAWGWVVVIASGLLMPVAGASMLVIGLLDALLFRLRRKPM